MSDQMPCERRAYEGDGGWNDGRLGQAYDLLWAVLSGRGVKIFRHPLLAQIEELDNPEENARG